mmetsp:Transcript_7558/g.15368  ORF Transcript_7558/g.15368 Transcript_7558/m.15368 type:complete len:258 (+) Transcript_7558:200-973(+)
MKKLLYLVGLLHLACCVHGSRKETVLSAGTLSDGEVLHVFVDDAVEWSSTTETARDPDRKSGRDNVQLEVRRVRVPGGLPTQTMLGVFLANGTIEPGQLVGCYTGEVCHEDEKWEGRCGKKGEDEYILWLNGTHFVNPVPIGGTILDTVPPYKREMAFVNEPYGKMQPNIIARQPCRDRYGALGRGFYALSRIQPGDELFMCYGHSYRRNYETYCARPYFRLLNLLLAFLAFALAFSICNTFTSRFYSVQRRNRRAR